MMDFKFYEPPVKKPVAAVIGFDTPEAALLQTELNTCGFQVFMHSGEGNWKSSAELSKARLLVVNDRRENVQKLRESLRGSCTARQYTFAIAVTDPAVENQMSEIVASDIDDFVLKPLDSGILRHRFRGASRSIRAHDKIRDELNERKKDAQMLANLSESHMLASDRFQKIFNGLPILCFTFDSNGMIQEFNRLAEDTFQFPEPVFHRHIGDVFRNARCPIWTQEGVDHIFSSAGVDSFDWSYVFPNGSEIHFACDILCFTNKHGERVGAIAGNLDITRRVEQERQLDAQALQMKIAHEKLEAKSLEVTRMNAKLHLLATTDGLTGLTNRRHFQENLEAICEECRRESRIFSLILFDVDHFKAYNDNFGHIAGDEVLQSVASILRDTARKYEQPARYGGEEFAVIVSSANVEESGIAAERFRAAIANHSWSMREITVSLGTVTFTGMETASEMIHQADLALYESKHQGRNRVTQYESLPQRLVS